MIKIYGSLFTLIFSLEIHARELNYIESKLFRLSGYERSDEWILPFYRYHKNSFPKFKFNLITSMQPEILDLVDDINSKSQDKIQTRLDKSYGEPYDASAKALIGYRHQRFTQTFASNFGALAIVNDPVFPELNGVLFQDYTMTSSYIFKPLNELTLIPRLIYGRRRFLDLSFSALQLAQKKPETKIANRPWNTFVELSLSSKYKMTYFDFVFEFNSIPLNNNDFDYWDTNLGIKSKNLNSTLNLDLRKIDLFILYSPIYGGNYDVIRTIKGGFAVEFNELFMIDLFFEDEFQFGAIAKFNSRYLNFSIFTISHSYDDLQTQKSRQFGLNITAQY